MECDTHVAPAQMEPPFFHRRALLQQMRRVCARRSKGLMAVTAVAASKCAGCTLQQQVAGSLHAGLPSWVAGWRPAPSVSAADLLRLGCRSATSCCGLAGPSTSHKVALHPWPTQHWLQTSQAPSEPMQWHASPQQQPLGSLSLL
jgi:hypothetical protein